MGPVRSRSSLYKKPRVFKNPALVKVVEGPPSQQLQKINLDHFRTDQKMFKTLGPQNSPDPRILGTLNDPLGF